jgi:HAD superfamily hydrolase (TIGR01490 family)
MSRQLALFDLDGTLIPGDSDHAFGEFCIRLGWADPVLFKARNDSFFADYQAGRLDIHAYVDFVTSAWRGRSSAELDHAVQRFLAEVLRPMLKPQALALVNQHREQGDTLALVTATNDFVTRPIAAQLGIETLLATDLARDADGRVTGAIAGVPNYREGKVTRVQQWLASRGQTLDHFERCTFYSDSTNDLPLLERVSHPVAANPGPALAQIAQERGWPVLKLFT